MSLILFVSFGFLVGLCARALSGAPRVGSLLTIWFGVSGSLLGALLTSFLSGQRVTELHTAGVLGSIVGTFAVLASGGVFRRPPSRHRTTATS